MWALHHTFAVLLLTGETQASTVGIAKQIQLVSLH